MDQKLSTSNAARFLREACDLLNIPAPDPEKITGAEATKLICKCLHALALRQQRP